MCVKGCWYSSGGGGAAAAGGVGGWGGGGRLWRLRGRRDALERGETRRLYLSRTPLQAVPCSWQHPGMAKEGTPTQIHAHAGAHTHTRRHTRGYTLRLILPSCGETDYRAFPPEQQILWSGHFVRACVRVIAFSVWRELLASRFNKAKYHVIIYDY